MGEQPPANAPIGYILSLEGADSILTPGHFERTSTRITGVGPAHYGPGRYAQGTHATGGLGPRGRELLQEMERLGIILDATHLCDDSFWEALDIFTARYGPAITTAARWCPNDRQFSDEQIKVLIARGAVIGGVLDAWMMVPGWKLFKTRRKKRG